MSCRKRCRRNIRCRKRVSPDNFELTVVFFIYNSCDVGTKQTRMGWSSCCSPFECKDTQGLAEEHAANSEAGVDDPVQCHRLLRGMRIQVIFVNVSASTWPLLLTLAPQTEMVTTRPSSAHPPSLRRQWMHSGICCRQKVCF